MIFKFRKKAPPTSQPLSLESAEISRINQEAWDEVSFIHKKSRFKKLLKNFSRPGASNIRGIKQEALLAHGLKNQAVFQPCCNNGRDLLSIKNLGASRCFGFDLSSEFIKQGKELAEAGKITCELVQADVYQLDRSYDDQFDIAYITAGSLSPLPDLEGFFAVIYRLMRPGAWLFLQEVHPLMDMFELEPSIRPQWLRFKHSYFRKKPYLVKKGLDYYRSTTYDAKPYYRFHHTMAEIIQTLIDCGLVLETFREYADDASGGRFKKIKNRKIVPPISYILTARRPA